MGFIKLAVNSGGLLVSIVGVYMVYHFSPINFDTVDGGDFSTDYNDLQDETKRRNSLLRVGVFVVIGGTILQLVSNFIPD